MYNYGTATLTGCAISGNSATIGGGLSSYKTATLTDCTISGNSANAGGGVNAYGPLTLAACTVSAIRPTSRGGVFFLSGSDSRRTIVDTIIAGNAANTSPDLFGTVDQDRGDNLIGDGDGASGFTAAGDQVGTAASPIDPKLAPLGDYDGPTQTMALLSGSPALGKGVAIAGITTDQRGFALDAPQPDIGAFQSQPTLVVNTTTDAAYGILSPPGAYELRPGRPGLADLLGGTQNHHLRPHSFAMPTNNCPGTPALLELAPPRVGCRRSPALTPD